MPLGDLKTITQFGDKEINGDDLNHEIYKMYEQKGNKPEANTANPPTLGRQEVAEPTPEPKPKARKPRAKKAKADDAALIKANKTDLNKRNLK